MINHWHTLLSSRVVYPCEHSSPQAPAPAKKAGLEPTAMCRPWAVLVGDVVKYVMMD